MQKRFLSMNYKPSRRASFKSVLVVSLLGVLLGGCQLFGDPTPVAAPTVVPPPAPATPSAAPSPAAQLQPQPVRFPQDDGPHSSLTEWWYYNGHLETASGENYGFIAVIFKRQPEPDRAGYVAHVAVTDTQRGSFQFKESLNVAAVPLEQGVGFRLQVGQATLEGVGGTDRVAGVTEDYAFELDLQSEKPPTLQGQDGFISVSPEEWSYYYSRTRMRAQGTLTAFGQTSPVTGLAWMDHQWGDFTLERGGGWDWFALMLDDGSDLMVSIIRDEAQRVVLAYGTLVAPDGQPAHLDGVELQVEATGSWTSPATKGVYPMGWRVLVPSREVDITVEPVIEQQEMTTWASVNRVYWEGQVTIKGQRAGSPVAGRGYVELTGYAPATPATPR